MLKSSVCRFFYSFYLYFNYVLFFSASIWYWFLVQFAETDFDFLQNREDSSKTWDDDPRNSILLKFDPLLRKPVPVFVEKLSNRLSNTTEEDDELIYIAGMNSNTTTIEETKQQYTTTRNSYNFNTIKEESMVDTNSLIIPLNNVDAMKDLINSTGGDNVNIDVNHYECADIKKTRYVCFTSREIEIKCD